jgi:hypothetical protein
MKKMPLVLYQIITMMVLLASFSWLFLSIVNFGFSLRLDPNLAPLSSPLLWRLHFPELASKIPITVEACIEATIGLIFIGLWFWLINRKR